MDDNNEKLHIISHPLLSHKISLMRDKNSGAKEFRELTAEVAMLMTYEVTRFLPLREVEVETPIAVAKTKVIAGRKVAFVPILRAGLCMVEGAVTLVPAAKVGHIGICRVSEREQTNGERTMEYYCKLPFDIKERDVIIMDLMLATGQSATRAVDEIKKAGSQSIKFMTVLACPEGIKQLGEAHPDIDIYCAEVDDGLNDELYITPGFGDGSDRIYGTK
ncbi:uracil phosphoribosyltransferase [Clostridia bacterium]|nr:uracil phosphoribosyltransferase [Clostridia bacterium]